MCGFDLLALAGDSVQGYVTKAIQHPCRVESVIPSLKMVKLGHRGGELLFQDHTGGRGWEWRGGVGSWRKLRFDFSQSPHSLSPPPVVTFGVPWSESSSKWGVRHGIPAPPHQLGAGPGLTLPRPAGFCSRKCD